MGQGPIDLTLWEGYSPSIVSFNLILKFHLTAKCFTPIFYILKMLTPLFKHTYHPYQNLVEYPPGFLTHSCSVITIFTS